MPKWLAISLVVATGLGYFLWLTWSTWPDQQSRVIFCDVGQGDATLITRGTTQFLIDGGPDDKVLECLARHMPWWDRQLEMMVATHADADHIVGLPGVFAQYQVQSIMLPDEGKDTQVYQALVTAIKSEPELEILSPEAGMKLFLGQEVLGEVIWPKTAQNLSFLKNKAQSETHLSAQISQKSNKNEESNSHNDGSISLYFTIGKISLLLTGDLEKAGEEALVASGLTKDINILKVGHHGSKTSANQSFIELVQPELSVISCGQNNRYSHPAPEVVSRLEKAGSRILRTDQVGEIVLISDGISYQVSF